MINHRLGVLSASAAVLFSFTALTLTPAAGVTADTITVSPTSFDFGTVMVGNSATETFDVTIGISSGNTFRDIVFAILASEPDLNVSVSGLTCSQTVSSCTFDALWTPQSPSPSGLVGDIRLTLQTSGGQTTTPPIDLSGTAIPGGATPLPAALPLFATGIGGLGLFSWRRKKRKAQAATA